MQQNSSELDVWFRFFKNASIPAGFAQNYAKKFVENRIRFEMLADLDRQLLNELGITAIGDCLSILKHAKVVSQQTTDFDVEPKSDIKNGANRMVASPEKTAISSTSLSNDLYSRLNFQPKTEDNSKAVMKRRLSSDEEMEVEKPARVHYNVVLNSKPATEIQSTVVQLNSNKKRVLSLDEQMKLDNIPVQRRISMEPGKANATIIRLNNNDGSITRTVQGALTGTKVQVASPVKVLSPVKKSISLAEKIANNSKFGASNAEVSVLNRIPVQKQPTLVIKKPVESRVTITKSLVNRIDNNNQPKNGASKTMIDQDKNIKITLKNDLAAKNRKVMPVPITFEKTGPKPTVTAVKSAVATTRPATVAKMNSVVARVTFNGAVQRINARQTADRLNTKTERKGDRALFSRISF